MLNYELMKIGVSVGALVIAAYQHYRLSSLPDKLRAEIKSDAVLAAAVLIADSLVAGARLKADALIAKQDLTKLDK
jgi:hypothetical protein